MRTLALLAALALAPTLAACGGSGGSGTPGSPGTEVQMTAAPANMTPVPVKDGDVWGPFLFFSKASGYEATVTVTPAPVADVPNEELIPQAHPGYRQFATPEELAAFAGPRARVLVPGFLPPGTQLLGADAVELEPGGRISDTGLSYRFAGSQQPIGDEDIWIASTYRWFRPNNIYPLAYTDPDGQVSGVPQRLIVRGFPAVYMPFTNPPGLHPSLQFRSTLNWFDDRGVYWAVQGRNLDLDTLFRIAESLQPLTPGG